jgi:hypothetical protein
MVVDSYSEATVQVNSVDSSAEILPFEDIVCSVKEATAFQSRIDRHRPTYSEVHRITCLKFELGHMGPREAWEQLLQDGLIRDWHEMMRLVCAGVNAQAIDLEFVRPAIRKS